MTGDLILVLHILVGCIQIGVALYFSLSRNSLLYRGFALFFLISGIASISHQALQLTFPAAMQTYDPHVYQVFLALRYISYLALLYAFYDYFRRGNRLVFGITAVGLSAVLFTAFFLPGYGASYYPVRLIIFLSVGLFTVQAFRDASLPFLYITGMSSAIFFSDLLKLSIGNASLIYEAQLVIDAVISISLPLIFSLALMFVQFRQQLVSLIRGRTLFGKQRGRGLEDVPCLVGRSAPEEGLGGFLARAIESSDQLAGTASELASFSDDDQLTIGQLAGYLGISEAEANEFLERSGIERIPSLGQRSKWIVSKQAVLSALERNGG